jgi:hypothetical protein
MTIILKGKMSTKQLNGYEWTTIRKGPKTLVLHKNTAIFGLFEWSRRSDSNRRPADYKSAALPTELSRLRHVRTMPQGGRDFNVDRELLRP